MGILQEYAAGAKVADLCRRHGMSQATLYKWKSRYGGMGVSELRRLRDLESENAELKRLLADSMLDNASLKGLLAKTPDACTPPFGGTDARGRRLSFRASPCVGDRTMCDWIVRMRQLAGRYRVGNPTHTIGEDANRTNSPAQPC